MEIWRVQKLPNPKIDPFKGELSENKAAIESGDVNMDESLKIKIENVIGKDFIKEIGGGYSFDIGMAEQYINWRYDQLNDLDDKNAWENLKNDKNLDALVIAIQSVLKKEMGTYDFDTRISSNAEGVIDGKISNSEDSLIVKFQNKFDLNPDGLLGKATLSKLKEWYSTSE